MIDPVRELKIRAELLHHRLSAGAVSAAERLRVLPELRRATADDLAAFVARIQRKHCLAAVARELGFESWDHASRVLRGVAREPDYGKLLYPERSGAFLNQWFATYEDARPTHLASAGYLLAYKRHVFLAGRDYVAVTLGLDPDDRDWEAIGFDWLRPHDAEARRRLYGKLLAAKREAA
jgi:hypothetical protein